MKFTIISASHRKTSESARIGGYLESRLSAQDGVDEVKLLKLAEEDIPLWDDSYWNAESDLTAHMKPYMDELASSDGYVLIAAEWGGMVPAALKNFMLYWGQNETGHKPAMLVGVSASVGGSYPIAELRMSGYKNSKIVYTPEHLIVRSAPKMMTDNDPAGGEGFDKDIRERAEHALHVLVTYAKAFKDIRATDGVIVDKYPFGM